MDFLALWPGNDCHLRAFDLRTLRLPMWRQRYAGGDRFEVITIFRLVAVCLIREINNAMACPDDHMLFIGMFGMRNLERRETAAGLQNARGRRTEHPVVIGLDGLGSEFLRPLGLFHRLDAGRIFVKLALRRIRHLHQRWRHRARHHARRLEIPVGASALARDIGKTPRPVADVVAIRRTLCQTHRPLTLRGRRWPKPAAGAIGHMQLVGTILVAEPVEQAVLFETAGEIVEIGLVKLYAVVLCRRRRDDA